MRTMFFGCCAGLLLSVVLGAASTQRTQWEYASIMDVRLTTGDTPVTAWLPNNRRLSGEDWADLYRKLGGKPIDATPHNPIYTLNIMGRNGFELAEVTTRETSVGYVGSFYFKRRR